MDVEPVPAQGVPAVQNNIQAAADQLAENLRFGKPAACFRRLHIEHTKALAAVATADRVKNKIAVASNGVSDYTEKLRLLGANYMTTLTALDLMLRPPAPALDAAQRQQCLDYITATTTQLVAITGELNKMVPSLQTFSQTLLNTEVFASYSRKRVSNVEGRIKALCAKTIADADAVVAAANANAPAVQGDII